MRIALLTDYPRDVDRPVGGVEAVARSLALGLSRCPDVDLHVLTLRPDVSRASHQRQFGTVTVHYLPQLGKLELATFFLQYRLLLGRLLRRIQPDVVHANDLGPYPYAASVLGYRYAVTVHGLQSTERSALGAAGVLARLRIGLLRRMENTSVKHATAIIANSNYVLRQISTSPHQPLFAIPNPVDPQFLEPSQYAPQPGRITWVGVMMRRKGLDQLVRALERTRQTVPDAHLRLIGPCGDAGYLDELKSLVGQLGLGDCVTFVGPRHAAQLRAEYGSASVVALSSVEENVPVAITEAMAMGRPVVSTRVGGVAELVQEGVTGLLCAPDDRNALANSLSRLLTHDALRLEMGHNARMAAQRFSLESVVAQHLSAYSAMRPC